VSSVLLDIEGYMARVRLNRPDKLNAIHPDMVTALKGALDTAIDDDAVRVIILCGEGRAFSAGFDLHGGSALAGESDTEQLRRELTDAFDIIMWLRNCPKPVIAAVHGYCLGSSMELSAVCDLTIAADDCEFGAPEVRFGSGIICMILPWIVGEKAARELLLLGSRIDAARALQIGLVSRVVARNDLMQEVESVAREMALNDPRALRLTKHAMNRRQDIAGLGQALQEALETDLDIESTETPESMEFNNILESDGLKAALTWRESLIEKICNEENPA